MMSTTSKQQAKEKRKKSGILHPPGVCFLQRGESVSQTLGVGIF
jgi:hypothetical protein